MSVDAIQARLAAVLRRTGSTTYSADDARSDARECWDEIRADAVEARTLLAERFGTAVPDLTLDEAETARWLSDDP